LFAEGNHSAEPRDRGRDRLRQGRDLIDPNAFIATEVDEDMAARERQAALPEVAKLTSTLPDCLSAPPQAIL